jgi:hypothetical protein
MVIGMQMGVTGYRKIARDRDSWKLIQTRPRFYIDCTASEQRELIPY